jgi:hypothetical protein
VILVLAVAAVVVWIGLRAWKKRNSSH